MQLWIIVSLLLFVYTVRETAEKIQIYPQQLY